MIPLRDMNPTSRKPVVTWVLIGLNIAFFLYELSLGDRLQEFFLSAAFIPGFHLPGGADHGIPLGLDNALLSMFLHGGFMHLAGNMLFLWIFGDNIEDRLGRFRFVLFYLLCGFAASYAQALIDPNSNIPLIGASGAISGVLGGYLLLYPKARIETLLTLGFFFQRIQVPALVFLPVWFLMQLLPGLMALGQDSGQGGIAWFAHIGGFLAGPLLIWLFGGMRKPRSQPPPPVARPPFTGGRATSRPSPFR